METRWSFLAFIFLLGQLSCQNNDRIKNTSDAIDQPTTEVDTSNWLTETRGIRDIMEDTQGNLWFSSTDYVAKFNGKEMHYFSPVDGLPIIGNLQLDAKGIIWVENGQRIFRYTGDTFLEEPIDSITDANGLWIQRGLDPTDTGYVQPGLYQVDERGTQFHPLPIQENITNKFLHLPSTKAVLGKDGTVWIGTMEKVYGFKDHSFVTIGRDEMGRQEDERQIGIRGIFIDSKDVLWIADNGAGIFSYDGSETVNFTKKYKLDEGDTEGSSLHRAFSIAEDSEGMMWFGTVYSGVWSFNPLTEEFTNYTTEHGLRSDHIWTIYKTREGNLLFAGESPAAVYIFNGKTFDRKY